MQKTAAVSAIAQPDGECGDDQEQRFQSIAAIQDVEPHAAGLEQITRSRCVHVRRQQVCQQGRRRHRAGVDDEARMLRAQLRRLALFALTVLALSAASPTLMESSPLCSGE